MVTAIVIAGYLVGAVLTARAAKTYILPVSPFGRHEEQSPKERRSRLMLAGAAVIAWPLAGVLGPGCGVLAELCDVYVWLCHYSRRKAAI